jgi:hypothetical protein
MIVLHNHALKFALGRTNARLSLRLVSSRAWMTVPFRTLPEVEALIALPAPLLAVVQ